tara:strand:+ start:109 stop:498 length:390 start_codon:yes stop_codon:yes gene_type:complete
MNEFLTVMRRWRDFDGRSSRREFWMFTLVILIASFVLGFIDAFLFGGFEAVPAGETFVLPVVSFSNAFSLITVIPSVSVSVRRLHDINRTGFWILISLTVIGLVLIIYWACLRSDEGDNQYGASPLGTE